MSGSLGIAPALRFAVTGFEFRAANLRRNAGGGMDSRHRT
jgi:hypothetical protein